MTSREQEAVVTALVQLAEALDAPMSEMRQVAYVAALSDLDARAVLAALAVQLRTATFMPKPAEIRQAVAGGSSDDAADLAWGTVLAAIRSVGRYSDPRRVLSAQAHAAMLATFGTWGAACDMSLDGAERQGCAKQFRAVYSAAHRRDTSQALTTAALPAGLREQARALIGGGQ